MELEQREILFRGQDLYTTKWIYGFFSQTTEKISYINWQKPGFAFHHDIVKSKTVTQYTGLKDCDGKRIFEGDIVKSLSSSRKYLIRFDKKGAIFIGENKKDTRQINGGCFKNTKIIGNIFDNPELLENIYGN